MKHATLFMILLFGLSAYAYKVDTNPTAPYAVYYEDIQPVDWYNTGVPATRLYIDVEDYSDSAVVTWSLNTYPRAFPDMAINSFSVIGNEYNDIQNKDTLFARVARSLNLTITD